MPTAIHRRAAQAQYSHLLIAAAGIWLGLGAALCVSAQSVSRVYPRYVVVGQVTQFTAEGNNLPAKASPLLGMKFAFDKPAVCTLGQRDKPTTTTAYHFSCQFQPGVTQAKLRVFHKPNLKASLKLWDGNVQVLDAPPKVDTMVLISPVNYGNSLVDCQTGQACTTVLGSLEAGKLLEVEVLGSNLPHTLSLDGPGCQPMVAAPATDTPSTSLLRFQCKLAGPGEQALTVLSAARDEGGQSLLTGRFSVIAAPAETASQ